MNKVVNRLGEVYPKDLASSTSFLYKNKLGRSFLKKLVEPKVSIKVGKFLDSSFSKILIKPFIRSNNIMMEQFKSVKYSCFNEFFYREIKDGYRPFSNDNNILVSPADSKLSAYQIDENTVMTIKGSQYTVKDLVQDDAIASLYDGGIALVFRLSVDDYHRYMAIDESIMLKHYKIDGILHTVHPIAMYDYPIFKQNSREVTLFQTKNFKEVTYIEVGAMLVGKITNYNHKILNRGQTKGYFEYGGSTVVLLFEKNTIQLDSDLIEYLNKDYEVKIKMGENIGKRL